MCACSGPITIKFRIKQQQQQQNETYWILDLLSLEGCYFHSHWHQTGQERQNASNDYSCTLFRNRPWKWRDTHGKKKAKTEITNIIKTTLSFWAIKLRNPLGFSYIKNMSKDQLFKTSGLQFDNWLFGPGKFSGLSRNRSLSWRKLAHVFIVESNAL